MLKIKVLLFKYVSGYPVLQSTSSSKPQYTTVSMKETCMFRMVNALSPHLSPFYDLFLKIRKLYCGYKCCNRRLINTIMLRSRTSSFNTALLVVHLKTFILKPEFRLVPKSTKMILWCCSPCTVRQKNVCLSSVTREQSDGTLRVPRSDPIYHYLRSLICKSISL